VEYTDHLPALREQDPALAAEVADLKGLGGVMAWMNRRGIPLADAEIVQQDEFSLDFLVPLRPDARWLALGIT
jgi:hypothetical protein